MLAGKRNEEKYLDDQLGDAKEDLGNAETTQLKELRTKVSHSKKELKLSYCEEAVGGK